MRAHSQLVSRVNSVLCQIFLSPGTYVRLVAMIAPNGSDALYDDPTDVTFLTEVNRLTTIHFPTLKGVNTLSVTQYLWQIFRVPHSVARHVLELYFRHTQRHSRAQQALIGLEDRDGVTDKAIDWVREIGLPSSHAEFVGHLPQLYAGRDLGRQVWRDEATRQW